MFEIESKKPEEITITTKQTSIIFNVAQFLIDANLPVGQIEGPGEFELGNVTIRGIGVSGGRVMYVAEIGGVRVGMTGDIEEKLDELGPIDILCASSTKVVKEVGPKLVIATGNVDGMVTDLKLTARTEKKLKIKNADALPMALEVVVLN